MLNVMFVLGTNICKNTLSTNTESQRWKEKGCPPPRTSAQVVLGSVGREPNHSALSSGLFQTAGTGLPN